MTTDLTHLANRVPEVAEYKSFVDETIRGTVRWGIAPWHEQRAIDLSDAALLAVQEYARGLERENRDLRNDRNQFVRFAVRVAERRGQFFCQSIWDDLADEDRASLTPAPTAEEAEQHGKH